MKLERIWHIMFNQTGLSTSCKKCAIILTLMWNLPVFSLFARCFTVFVYVIRDIIDLQDKISNSAACIVLQRCNWSEFIKLSNDGMMNLLKASGITKQVKFENVNPDAFKIKSPDDMILCVGGTRKHWKLLAEDNLRVVNDEQGWNVLTTRGNLKNVTLFS